MLILTVPSNTNIINVPILPVYFDCSKPTYKNENLQTESLIYINI